MEEFASAHQGSKGTGLASNPLHRYCADPDLVMIGDRWYLYCTEDGLPDWSSHAFYVYESGDLCHWTRRKILDLDQVPWWHGGQGAWAPCLLVRQGRCILYFVADGQIGQAVAPGPTGPFRAAQEPFIARGDYDCLPIDPSVFVDDDDVPYLLWGNGRAYMGRLSPDGLRLEEGSVRSAVPDNFREAITVCRRGDTYYASWSENDTRDPNYRIRWSNAPSLDGPWTAPQILVKADYDKGILATGHHCITRVPGRDDWIVAYHRFARDGQGDGCHREIVFAPLDFADDGAMVQVRPQVGSYWYPARDQVTP